jgi:hypothetical protein
MPKATAVWLVDNTTLSFEQIADFCGMHTLEVKGIADGEVAVGIVGFDSITSGQLTRDEIVRCEADPAARLKLNPPPVSMNKIRAKAGRYTPVSKRQDRPNAIAWILKFHPELTDAQIQRLLGTTKATIKSVRERSHWNVSNIKAQDPVALAICSQLELDKAVLLAQKQKKAREKRELRAERAAQRASLTPEQRATEEAADVLEAENLEAESAEAPPPAPKTSTLIVQEPPAAAPAPAPAPSERQEPKAAPTVESVFGRTPAATTESQNAEDESVSR